MSVSDLQLSIYSRDLLGHETDASLFSRKKELLSTCGLWSKDQIRVSSVSDLYVLFRVCHFSKDDLVVCARMSLDEIEQYRNPCNSRKAFKVMRRVVAAAELKKLASELDLKFASLFHPTQSSSNRACRDIFPSLSSVASGIAVASGASGLCLVAEANFEPGDIVISLPPDIPISLLSAFRDPRFPGTDLFEQGLHPDVVFMLFLIFLRDKAATLPTAVHRDFFACQPKSFGTLFELPSGVVEALDEPDLIDSVRTQNSQLETICASLHPSPSFPDLLWAKCLCASRAFSLPIPPQSELESLIVQEYYPDGKLTTLLPVVHFCNHDFQAQCDTPSVNASSGAVELRALGRIASGNEIFILYGGMTNKEFLLNYGFFVPENPYDHVVRSDGALVRRGATRGLGTKWNPQDGLAEGYKRGRFVGPPGTR